MQDGQPHVKVLDFGIAKATTGAGAEVKVLDFGIAKATTGAGAEATRYGEIVGLIGTPNM